MYNATDGNMIDEGKGEDGSGNLNKIIEEY
jgi:hypothetical protein